MAMNMAYSKSILALDLAAIIFIGILLDASIRYIVLINLRVTPNISRGLINLWALYPRKGLYIAWICMGIFMLFLSWYWAGVGASMV